MNTNDPVPDPQVETDKAGMVKLLHELGDLIGFKQGPELGVVRESRSPTHKVWTAVIPIPKAEYREPYEELFVPFPIPPEADGKVWIEVSVRFESKAERDQYIQAIFNIGQTQRKTFDLQTALLTGLITEDELVRLFEKRRVQLGLSPEQVESLRALDKPVD